MILPREASGAKLFASHRRTPVMSADAPIQLREIEQELKFRLREARKRLGMVKEPFMLNSQPQLP
jgi:hypothetical protein